jgi:GT2 family glycosyltransferase
VAPARGHRVSRPRRVSVAIVSWNGREHLETCLAALHDQHDPGVPWEVLLLDNGSRDGTAAWVRTHHPEVRLLESSFNTGFCAANNRLVHAATGDVVAFLNNDTRPRPEWLAALVDALAAAPADVAAVSGMIVDWSGARLDFAEGLMTFDGHALQRGFHRPLHAVAVPRAGDALLFACAGNMLVRRSSFLAAGGFDDAYFAYYEDVDLGWRLWSGGERVTFAPDALVHHRGSATSDRLGRHHRGFLFERNAFLTAYKNYEAGLWEQMMPAVMLALLSRTRAALVDDNPVHRLDLDPYAGSIADTAPPVRPESLGEKWRKYGAAEFLHRGALKAWRLARRRRAVPPVRQAQSQVRAISWILRHLDDAAVRRAAVQARRARPDREIFARFPPALVPTYPGDEALFGSAGFEAWLPKDVPFLRLRLDEIMEA